MKRKCKNGEANSKSPKPKKKKSVVMEPIHINTQYQEEAYVAEFRKGFEKSTKPFPHWQLKNFVLNNENVVEKVEEELQNFDGWQRKENDLYSLYQTNDLKSIDPVSNPAVFSFRQFLYTEVKEWLQKVSGVELTEQVDCNGSCYARTDSLLPHNDLIETRRFAFVYYMTSENWDSKANGGALQLFHHDKQLQPTSVAVQFSPLRNSLMLFEVSEKSWHRVAEMLSDEPRLSINGWFHSQRRIKPRIPEVETIQRFVPENKYKLLNLVNKEYLQKSRQNEVQSTFADSSELNLSEFLVLLRISPSPNAASIVFREPGVMSFMKYANCNSSEPYYLFTVSFCNVQVVDD